MTSTAAPVEFAPAFDELADHFYGESPSFADMSHDQRLGLGIELEQMRHWLDATMVRLLAYDADHPDPLPVAHSHSQAGEFLRDEWALALGWSFGMAHDRISTAQTIVHTLPATLAAVEREGLSYYKAVHLAKAVKDCDPSIAARIEARVLPRAATQNLPTFQKSLRRAVLAIGPADRQSEAAKGRAVMARPVEDGMGLIQALVPGLDMTTIMAAIQAVADAYPKDDRTADQRRADALADICAAVLNGDLPTSIKRGKRPRRRVALEVSIGLSALLGHNDEPGELAGFGPLSADLIRDLALDPGTRWRTLIVDDHGCLVDYGRTTYKASSRLKNIIAARHRTCSVPGCQRHARTCDVDHLKDWARGGRTCACNCHPLCPHHHKMKHDGGWHIDRLPDGTYVWTTPTGRTYVKPPTELPH